MSRKGEFETSPHFRTEGSGDGEASVAKAEATGRRMVDAGRGEVRDRKGVPGGRTERTGAGRRSPGMRRQPPPLADTERSEQGGAAADRRRCPRRLSPRKTAWPRLREGAGANLAQRPDWRLPQASAAGGLAPRIPRCRPREEGF